MLDLQEEHGHLGARDGAGGAEESAAAAGRDAFVGERLDPVGEERGAGDVGEVAGAGRGVNVEPCSAFRRKTAIWSRRTAASGQ